MKKSWLALVVLFVAVLSVGATASAKTGAGLSGVVRVGSWESGDALIPWNNSIASFKAANPGVDVQLEAVPQDYGTKLLAQFAAGNAPDVFMVGDGDAAKFQSLGASEDLAPYIAGKDGFDPSISFPAVAAFGNVAGSTYYMTKDYSPLVMFYNVDQFKEAGLDAPKAGWTLDDMLKMAQTLTIDAKGNNALSKDFDPKTIKRWGLQIPDGWGDPLWLRGVLPLIYQGNGSLISDDGKATTGHMNSDATVAALQWYVDLFTKYHVAPTKDDVASFSGTDMFKSGLVSMMWTGIWPLLDYQKVTDFHFGTVELPAGKSAANVLCWAGFGLYSGSKNKDAAWAFLKYISTGDGAKEFSKYALTAVQSIAKEDGLDTDPYKASVIRDLANVKPLPESTTPLWNECGGKAFGDQFATVFDGGVSVKDAMDKAAADADACLAAKK